VSYYIHGHARTGRHSRIFMAWMNMKQRCLNPRNRFYHNYGGRGITVCERWMTFRYFLEDMGIGKKGWTIERVNNDGNYCIENIVWATRSVQLRNTRRTVIVTVNGVTGCVKDLCERFGAPYRMTCKRIKRGWSAQRAFDEPSRKP